MNHIKGMHHVAIRAVDFDKTLKFYVDGLGYCLKHSWSLPSFNLKRAAMLSAPDNNSYIELYDAEADIPAQGRKRLDDEPFIQTALLHLCLSVTDSAAAFNQAIAAGASPLLPPMTLSLGDIPTVVVNNSLVYSPNGEVIEFLEETSFG